MLPRRLRDRCWIPPTPAELGLASVEISVWAGVLAPVATPDAVIHTVNRKINAALASAEVRESLAKLGVEPMPGSPAAFGAFIAAEAKTWGDLVALSGEKAR